jgi:hypothetical protein
MKKRSLFAAVAMLIVSAIVLTSSTYAWFSAAGSAATVEKVICSVNGRDQGNVQVANAQKSSWVTTLTASSAGTGNTNMSPVSYDPLNGNGARTISYNGEKFSAGTAAESGSMVEYTWYVRAISGYDGKKIYITTSFDAGSEGVMYGAVKVGDDGNWNVFGAAAGYTYLGTVTAANDDGSTATVVDSTDTGITSGQALGQVYDSTNINSSSVTYSIPAATVAANTTNGIPVYVKVWAEGQSANCHGTVNNQGAGFEFTNIHLDV